MKKISFLMIYAVTVIIPAQGQKNGLSSNFPTFTNAFLSPFQVEFEATSANKVNIKAVWDFLKSFKTVQNHTWGLTSDGGSTSTFTSREIKTKVVYDIKGRRSYIMRIYEENKLNDEIRDIVKREYYDATITMIKEIETDDGVAIFVHMQDKNTWKIVRIVDGKMDLLENFIKG